MLQWKSRGYWSEDSIDKNMDSLLHLSFGFYVVSLLSGVLLLTALNSDPVYRRAIAFREFTYVYLLITAFVCITTICLYLAVNIEEAAWVGGPVVKVYISATIMFLCLLPWLICSQSAELYGFDLPANLRTFLAVGLVYGIGSAMVVWFIPGEYHVVLVGIAVIFMLVVLVINNAISKSHYGAVFDNSVAKYVSAVMVAQSLALPALELVFGRQHLANQGFTLSLPFVFLTNNVLTWYFKTELLAGVKEGVVVNDISGTLSPKELEIAHAVAQGLSNKEIAFELKISPSTVKNHLYTIFKKFNVTNRVALLAHLQAK